MPRPTMMPLSTSSSSRKRWARATRWSVTSPPWPSTFMSLPAIFSAPQRLGTCRFRPPASSCMAKANSCNTATVSSAVARPLRCSRDRDSQVMIELYRSARCSGNRRSFQCTTANAVSITGLRVMRRISGRARKAVSNSSQCSSAAARLCRYSAWHQRDKKAATASSDNGSIRACAKPGNTASPMYAAGRLVTTNRQPRYARVAFSIKRDTRWRVIRSGVSSRPSSKTVHAPFSS